MDAHAESSKTDGPFVAAAAAGAVLFCLGFSMLEGLATGPRGMLGPAAGLQLYWLGTALSWGTLTLLAWHLWRRAGSGVSAAGETRAARWVVVAVALVLRLWVIEATTPQLSDDMHRYVFDGRNLAAGENPYRHVPVACRDRDAATHRLVQRINNPELATIYLPTSQWLFAATAALTDPHGDPFGYVGFRCGFVIVEMAALFLVMHVLASEGRSRWWAALYAWHPLAISEVAGSGHQDALGLMLLVASLLLLSTAHRPETRWWRRASGGVLFALCAGVKPVALPLLVPIVWRMRSERRGALIVLAAGLSAVAALIVPFLLMEGGLTGLWETGQTFVDRWSHNGSVHALLAEWIGHDGASRVCLGLLAGVVGVAAWRGTDLWRAATACLFAEALLSSTVHPWYLLWPLVLIPIRFNAALWVLTMTVTWSYAAWRDDVPWQLPTWILVSAYAPVYALLAGWACHGAWRRISGLASP